MTDKPPPQGFVLHSRASPMTEPWMPIYRIGNARSVYLGVWLEEKHCNSRGLVHGGFIAALADNTMGYTCGQAMKADGRTVSGLVTISLNVDYLGSAKLGQWMTWEPEMLKAGGSIAFATALVKADGDIVARANASFKIAN
ncbi:MAG: PaaI family thioesterase [Hyphomonadaceae bacterium]